MRARVSLQIEGVVESLSAEGAEVALRVTVAFHVTVQKSLQAERFGTEPALKLARVAFWPGGWKFFKLGWLDDVAG